MAASASLPIFLKTMLRSEFDKVRGKQRTINVDELTQFMALGYPNSSRTRIELGARIILDQFSMQDDTISFKDITEMYNASYQTNPLSIFSEFNNRGYSVLRRHGDFLLSCLGFGFEPYILECNASDDEKAIRDKCMKALQSLFSGILIFVIIDRRVSLLIPCIAEQFLFLYFNPHPTLALDVFIAKCFRHVRDLQIWQTRKDVQRDPMDEIRKFISIFSTTYRHVEQTTMFSAESIWKAVYIFLGCENASKPHTLNDSHTSTEAVSLRKKKSAGFKSPVKAPMKISTREDISKKKELQMDLKSPVEKVSITPQAKSGHGDPSKMELHRAQKRKTESFSVPCTDQKAIETHAFPMETHDLSTPSSNKESVDDIRVLGTKTFSRSHSRAWSHSSVFLEFEDNTATTDHQFSENFILERTQDIDANLSKDFEIRESKSRLRALSDSKDTASLENFFAVNDFKFHSLRSASSTASGAHREVDSLSALTELSIPELSGTIPDESECLVRSPERSLDHLKNDDKLTHADSLRVQVARLQHLTRQTPTLTRHQSSAAKNAILLQHNANGMRTQVSNGMRVQTSNEESCWGTEIVGDSSVLLSEEGKTIWVFE